jgi:hypothetical protein
MLDNFAHGVRVSPAGDVWVGSVRGASVLRAGAAEWQRLDHAQGLRGGVRDFAFAPDGAVWMLWDLGARRGVRNWGVSAWHADGGVHELELGRLTQFEPPLSRQPLAVDAAGGVWIVTQSLARREKTLVVAMPDGEVSVYSLGKLPLTGPFAYPGTRWWESYGVLGDGQGGVVLLADNTLTWRWKP